MKKLSLLLACLPAVLFSACEKPQAPRPEKAIKIGFSVPSRREPRWARDLEQLRKLSEEMGVELLTEVSDNNAAQQADQCASLLANKISVLIIAPQDAAAAAGIVRLAHSAGVKVIAYDRMILGEAVDLYVSFDNEKVGAMQARSLAALAPRGNYILLSGATTDNNAALYRRGALGVLEPLVRSGEIKIVMDAPVKDWHATEAQRLAGEALAQYKGNIQAIVAPNDTTAGAAIRALERYKLDGRVPVSGQDAEASAVRRILAGTQSMTVFKDPRQQAAAAFGAAMSLASGGRAPATTTMSNGSAEVPSLLLAPQVVDRKNMTKALLDTGFIKNEELYGPQGEQAPGGPR